MTGGFSSAHLNQLSHTTNQIIENSKVLKRANVEIDESNEGTTVHASSFERQMLFKYVTAWNELAIAYQDSNKHVEAIEAFLTAI